MKIEIKKQDGNEVEIGISGGSVAFANAVRRTAMSEIPTFAIEDVTFYENTSSFFDEYITNRLALIPLKTDPRYTEKDEVVFTLDAQGPGTVYSKELKSTDRKIIVASENIPIMKLADKQTIRLEAKAVLGTSRKHAKHQSCLASYSYKDDKPDTFEMKLESFGQLSPAQILAKTAELLETKCDEFEKGMKEGS